jgi:hypothetical protein
MRRHRPSRPILTPVVLCTFPTTHLLGPLQKVQQLAELGGEAGAPTLRRRPTIMAANDTQNPGGKVSDLSH